MKHARTGLYYREGTYDKAIIGEIAKSYGQLTITEKDTVLDIGGCFGAFVNYAADFNPKKIITIEPEKENFALLKRNCKSTGNVFAINAACITGKEKTIPFYLTTSGKNPGNYSTTQFRGRKEVRVPCVNFKDILKKYKPSIIKMDCEGSEYDLLETPLPLHVKQIAMEIHLSKKIWREQYAPNLIKSFSKWECLAVPKITEQNWHTLATWRRK